MTETLTDVTDLYVDADAAPFCYRENEPSIWAHGYNTAVDRLAGRIDTLRHEVERLREQLALREAEHRTNQRF